MTGSRRWRIVALVWAAVIVVSGVVPISEVAEAVGPADQVTTVGHFVAYAVFAFLLALALAGWRITLRELALAFVIAVALGAAIEVVQGPLPYRDASLVDLSVDAAGAVVGLAVVSVAARGERSRSHPG